MKLTKIKIEELVEKIEKFLCEHNLLDDVCIYFNNKRRLWRWSYKTGDYTVKEEENIDPHNYFEYAARKHIISMSFEGSLYNVLHGYSNGWEKIEEKFVNLFHEHGLYYELGNAWNLTCYPNNDDMEIEYTVYEEKLEPEYLYLGNSKYIPPELKNIMLAWYKFSEMTGDKGSCVLGAGFKFTWNGKEYFMSACSPWQGSISWETHTKIIEDMLRNIGATNIHYDFGRLD